MAFQKLFMSDLRTSSTAKLLWLWSNIILDGICNKYSVVVWNWCCWPDIIMLLLVYLLSSLPFSLQCLFFSYSFFKRVIACIYSDISVLCKSNTPTKFPKLIVLHTMPTHFGYHTIYREILMNAFFVDIWHSYTMCRDNINIT